MKEKKFTYHWVIVLACFLMMAASIGIVINCFNVFTVELMAEFGWDAGDVQLIGTIVSLAALIGGAVVGKVMARFTMRRAIPVYAVVTAAGFFLYRFCHSLPAFYAVSLVVGLGMSGVSLIPCGALINNWFSEKKGTATGIAFTGSVAGGMILVQVTQAVVDASGWRMGYTVLGVISAVVLIPTALFLVRESPRDKGLLPLGVKPGDSAAAAPLTGISAGRFLKTGSFWLLALSMFIIGFINMGMQNNFSIYMQDELGHSESFSTNIFTLVMGIQVVGKVLLGAVYDKKGVKFGTAYCTLLFLLAAGCSLAAGNTAAAVAFGALFGLVCSMTTVSPPYLTMLVAGRRNYSVIYGLLSLFYGVGVAVGPVVAAKVFDSGGSYAPAWIAFMVLSFVMAAATVAGVRRSAEYSTASN